MTQQNSTASPMTEQLTALADKIERAWGIAYVRSGSEPSDRPQRKGARFVEPTVCYHDHIGRVLAERHRIGPAGLYDARMRAKMRMGR